MKVIRQRKRRSAEFDAFGFCCNNSLGLTLANVLVLILCYK